jgi:hypothetical protein
VNLHIQYNTSITKFCGPQKLICYNEILLY